MNQWIYECVSVHCSQVLFAFLTLLVMGMYCIASRNTYSMDEARRQGTLWMRALLVHVDDITLSYVLSDVHSITNPC